MLRKCYGAILVDLFTNASSGIFSLSQLIDLVNKQGFGNFYTRKADHNIITEILRNPFYYGMMTRKNGMRMLEVCMNLS